MDYFLSKAHIDMLKILVSIWTLIVSTVTTATIFCVYLSGRLYASSFALCLSFCSHFLHERLQISQNNTCKQSNMLAAAKDLGLNFCSWNIRLMFVFISLC